MRAFAECVSVFQFSIRLFPFSLLRANMAAGQLADPGINNAQGIQRAVM